MKIKLPDGNVASRVLPVTIYDLDPSDIKECETVLGGVLRGVEFIYKEPGVNRPLTPNDDENKNLNRTKYRNQINKVANAINEILAGLKNEPAQKRNLLRKDLRTSDNPTANEKSILVLPFENMSSETEQEYFSDGLTEEIITDLSHIHELLVISRSSAMTFKGTKFTIKEIAEKVKVRYVLEGSVRKAGNNLRITAQLIDAADDYHIWAAKYNENLENIFEIQEKVSRSITEALKVKLYPEERKQTSSIRAYDLYMLGRYYWNKRTREGLLASIEYFLEAVESDDKYALAYAGLADAYMVCADWNYMQPEISFKKAREYAEKSLSIDSNIAEAYPTLAGIAEIFERNYKKAEGYYQTALSLNPNYASAHQWYGLFLTVFGKFDAASEHMNQAVKLDPLSAIKNGACGLMYYFAESYDKAIFQCKKAVELDPEFPVNVVGFYTFISYFMKGLITEAIDEYQKIIDDNQSLVAYKNSAKEVYAKSGIDGFLDFIINLELEFHALSSSTLSKRIISILYALRGNKGKALDYIEASVNEFDTDYIYLNVEPAFKSLRAEPRFIALLRKLGLE
jgi:TolB-like protein